MSIGAGILAIARVLRWPVLGGLFAAGAVATGRWAAPRYLADTARDLGGNAGEGFAEGVLRFNRMVNEAADHVPVLSGRWSQFPRGLR